MKKYLWFFMGIVALVLGAAVALNTPSKSMDAGCAEDGSCCEDLNNCACG